MIPEWNRSINIFKPLIFVFLLLTFSTLKAQLGVEDIYTVRNGDTVLTQRFIQALCEAARNPEDLQPGLPSYLEQLIILAAGTGYRDKDKPIKSLKWHRRFGSQCICDDSSEYPSGSFLKQVVHSNFREFANLVGPNNSLSLDLSLVDPDGQTIFEYINSERIRLEAKHDNKRFEFQQDEEWRNIMFFYFLFSEYRVN